MAVHSCYGDLATPENSDRSLATLISVGYDISMKDVNALDHLFALRPVRLTVVPLFICLFIPENIPPSTDVRL